MHVQYQKWVRISLLNLLIVAFIGVILRYKITFYLPFIDQKHLLHGHSHFAFAGWVSMALMSLLVYYLYLHGIRDASQKYRYVLLANLLTAIGMLISFPIEGYGPYSIFFSSSSIIVSYVFSIMYWKDLNSLGIHSPAHKWFKASLLFSALSSIGAFALAVMMYSGVVHQTGYLASEYFYLHFQYNGWFFFCCMGLLLTHLQKAGIPDRYLKQIFPFFILSVVPAYLLSTLWMKLPVWLYLITILAVIIQFAGWWKLMALLKIHRIAIRKDLSKTSRIILGLSFVAFSIKIMLQTGSVIPAMSTLAFGFRPIVIGYLHLVLLGITSLFIIGYALSAGLIPKNKFTISGIGIFAAGIILNELLLMTQGLSALYYIPVPGINEYLFFAALLMFIGLILLNLKNKI